RNGLGDLALFVLRDLRADGGLGDQRQRGATCQQGRSDAINITHDRKSSSFFKKDSNNPGCGGLCGGAAERRLNMNGPCSLHSSDPPRAAAASTAAETLQIFIVGRHDDRRSALVVFAEEGLPIALHRAI